MSARILITCDDCSATAPPAKSHASARRAIGWRNPKRGIDFCPDCSTKRKAAKAEADAKIPGAYRGYF